MDKTTLLAWMMIIQGPDHWKYIKAEPPCMKGEIVMSFRFCHVVIAWQRKILE